MRGSCRISSLLAPVQLLYTVLFPAATKTGEELDTFVNVDHEFFTISFAIGNE
jgi:hypothetical protein